MGKKYGMEKGGQAVQRETCKGKEQTGLRDEGMKKVLPSISSGVVSDVMGKQSWLPANRFVRCTGGLRVACGDASTRPVRVAQLTLSLLLVRERLLFQVIMQLCVYEPVVRGPLPVWKLYSHYILRPNTTFFKSSDSV
jgi:hypothetical protein